MRCVFLSRNFGKEAALTAGIHEASGDVVVLMDSDLQHPVAMIPVFLEKWREGYEMVYGVRANRDDESFLKRLLTNAFYKLLQRASRIPIEPDAGDFRLLDRKVVESLKALPERSRFMKGLYAWVGYKSIGIPFQVEERRSGSTTFNFRRLTRLAIMGMVAFSELPLRISAVTGLRDLNHLDYLWHLRGDTRAVVRHRSARLDHAGRRHYLSQRHSIAGYRRARRIRRAHLQRSQRPPQLHHREPTGF